MPRLIIFWILANTFPLMATGQEVVNNSRGETIWAIPQPSFLPDQPHAVIRVGSLKTLVAATSKLFGESLPWADLLTRLKGVASPVPSNLGLRGVHVARPFWVFIQDPANLDLQHIFSDRGRAQLFRIRTEGFVAIPLHDEPSFLGSLEARRGKPRRLSNGMFVYRSRGEVADYQSMAEDLLDDSVALKPEGSSRPLYCRLHMGYALLSETQESLERVPPAKEIATWVAIPPMGPEPSSSTHFPDVKVVDDPRVVEPMAAFVCTLDLRKFPEGQLEILHRGLSSGPRVSEWESQLMGHRADMERAVFALKVVGRKLQVLIRLRATKGSTLALLLQSSPDDEPLGIPSNGQLNLQEKFFPESESMVPFVVAHENNEWIFTMTVPAGMVPKLLLRMRELDESPVEFTTRRLAKLQGQLSGLETQKDLAALGLIDGWGRPLIASRNAKGNLTIESLGRDGLAGGTGNDADLKIEKKPQ